LILYGDFSKYVVRDVREVRLLRLNELYAQTDQVGFVSFMRTDGNLLDAGTKPVKWLNLG
jgi:HK97 family phage major capsid protein